jgi:hypothetical protein
MNEEFAIFEALIEATTAAIGDPYFQLPVAQLADAVYRERVYCYELYHQLRSIWNGFDFSLGGEVDKAGHPHFRDGHYAHAKPDFLVHRPGGHGPKPRLRRVEALCAALGRIQG